jgi:hypothetical protein
MPFSKKRGSSALVAVLVGVVSVFFSGCRQAGDASLSIVGEGPGGEPRAREVSAAKLFPLLSKSIRKTHLLAGHAFDSTPESGWELKRVTLGLELEGEVGLARSLELGGEAAIELRYQRLR